MSIRKAFVWSFAGQIVSFVAVFGTTIVLSRLLSPHEIGIYAVGLALSGVLQGLATFGVGNYLVRDHELAASTRATAFTLNLVISLALALAVAGCSLVGAFTLGEPKVAEILRMLALVPLIGIVEFLPATLLQREMNFSAISIVTITRTVASAIVSIAAALLGMGATSSAYGALAFALTGALGFNLAAHRHAGFRLSAEGWRPMVGFGLKTMSIGGISMVSMRLADVLLGKIAGITALGYFSRASAISNSIFQNVYGSITRVLFAKLAEDSRSGRGIARSYLASLDIVLAIMWPALAGLAVLARPVVTQLFGERWFLAADPLSILMLGQMATLAFAMHTELFVLRDRVGEQGKLEFIRTLCGLIGFAIGCSFGLVGAAVGRLVDPLIGILLYLPRLPRLSGARGREIVLLQMRNLLLTAVAVAPAAMLMTALHWPYRVPPLACGASIGAGILAWLIALKVMAHPLFGEIMRVINRFAGRGSR